MYKGHSNWDEDKWDIHSSGSGGYAGHSSGGGAVGYAGHSSKDSNEEYHKNEVYSANKPEDDKIKDSYRSNEKEEDKKKEDDKKEKTIVDAVEQEEKYQKKEEEEPDQFQAISKDIQQSNIDNDSLNNKINKETKKKNNKSIEDAIKVAIKEEKEIVHVD